MTEHNPAQTPVRLSRRVVEMRQCSRREADQLIEGGWVAVDGAVVEEPQFMVSTQRITIDPAARPTALEPVTLLLHKPAGVEYLAGPDAAVSLVRSESQWALDDSRMRHLKRHFAGLTPLVPLERDASGLFVLSQDASVVRRLMEEGHHVEQEYIVEVDGEIAPYGLVRLNHGLSFKGRALAPCKVSWQNEIRLRFAVKGVQPGQLRDVCAQVGLTVVAMRRIRIGRVPLGKLPPGEWRYLPADLRF